MRICPLMSKEIKKTDFILKKIDILDAIRHVLRYGLQYSYLVGSLLQVTCFIFVYLKSIPTQYIRSLLLHDRKLYIVLYATQEVILFDKTYLSILVPFELCETYLTLRLTPGCFTIFPHFMLSWKIWKVCSKWSAKRPVCHPPFLLCMATCWMAFCLNTLCYEWWLL